MKSLVLSLLLLVAPFGGFVQAVNPLVDLGYTRLRGVAESSGSTRWLGVRYAAAPTGRLRFAAPQDPPNTNGVQDASKVSNRFLVPKARPS